MAHTKAGGSTRQKANRRGRRLGLKRSGGHQVAVGHVLVRQRGTTIHAGDGVKMGRDFTLYSVKTGAVKFFQKTGRRYISVI